MSLTLRPLIATTGVVCLAAAGILRFVVVPSQAQLPADLDTSRTYTGTVTSMLDAQALASGDLTNAVLRDIPVTLTRDLVATGVDGSVATVAETATMTAPDGTVLVASSTDHVVDRVTMLAADDREGLLIGWPVGTEQRDYTGWSSDLAAPVDVRFVGTEERAGVDTLVFHADFEGRIVDPATLARFPASLPTAILPVAAEALGVAPAITEQLPTLLERLPAEVALAYTLSSDTTYWVEPTTGMIIDLEREEHRYVALDAEGVPPVPLADVFGVTYTGEAASVAATADEAKANAAQLGLYGTTLPVVLGLLGLALVVLSVLPRTRRKDDEALPHGDGTADAFTAARQREIIRA